MTVYVLGAGASIHAKYPLASKLGASLEAWIRTLPPNHDYHLGLSQIVDAYGTLDGFESILADLITCKPDSPAARLEPRVRPNLLSVLQEAIREYFDTVRTHSTPLYDQLAGSLHPGDVVVTYNYDLGIERALGAVGVWDIQTGYGFPIGDAQAISRVEVLKLHGSTNWHAPLFGGHTGSGKVIDSLGHRPVLLVDSDSNYLGFPDFRDPLRPNRDSAVSLPAIIMPALPKTFCFKTSFGEEWKPFWDRLWQRAKDAIEKAEALVIIGYSLPEADERARELLLRARNKAVRLTICCERATGTLEDEFRGNGFTNVRRIPDPTFEGFNLCSAKLTDNGGP